MEARRPRDELSSHPLRRVFLLRTPSLLPMQTVQDHGIDRRIRAKRRRLRRIRKSHALGGRTRYRRPARQCQLRGSHVYRVDRLDKRGFLEADIVGQGDDTAFGHPGHGFYVFGEAAAVWHESACQSRGLVLFALGEETVFAIETRAAGDVMKAHHAVAELPSRYAPANCNYRACQFMSKDLRRRNVSVKNLLDVSAADPAGGNLDKDFAIAHFRYGDFLDADDTLFAVDAGAHGLGVGTEGACRARHRAECAHTVATFSCATGNAAINSSKKLANLCAAWLLCRPNRTRFGSLLGRRTIAFTKLIGFIAPCGVKQLSKSMGRSSSAASLTARIVKTGTLAAAKYDMMIADSMSTASPKNASRAFSSAVGTIRSTVISVSSGKAPCWMARSRNTKSESAFASFRRVRAFRGTISSPGLSPSFKAPASPDEITRSGFPCSRKEFLAKVSLHAALPIPVSKTSTSLSPNVVLDDETRCKVGPFSTGRFLNSRSLRHGANSASTANVTRIRIIIKLRCLIEAGRYRNRSTALKTGHTKP